MNTPNSPDSLLVTIESSLRRSAATGTRICVGLSGGIDSVVLLEALWRQRAPLAIDLSAIHVHHGLSTNADRWAAFCGAVCKTKSIPLTVVKVAIDRSQSGGVESLAREARYAAFNSINADFLALAQHADDQAETVLHQMLRGTGLKGMAGMGETRRLGEALTLIRPMLAASRAEIEAFARQHHLEWLEDESNADTALTRNYIRREIVPMLAKRFPHYRDSLARAGRHAADADEMLEALAAIDLKWDGQHASADALDGLPLTRQVNALYYWMQWQQVAAGDAGAFPSQAQLAAWAQQLFRPAPIDRPHQAGGHEFVIWRRKNLLSLERK